MGSIALVVFRVDDDVRGGLVVVLLWRRVRRSRSVSWWAVGALTGSGLGDTGPRAAAAATDDSPAMK